MAGVAVALIAGAIWQGSTRKALVGAGAVGLAGVVLVGPGGIIEYSVSRLGDRPALWQRSLAMILDMPFTGVGLNNFDGIVRTFYPGVFPLLRAGEYHGSSVIPHAHNLFLQTAVDLGLFGFGAFIAIVAMAIRAGVAAANNGVQRPLAVGLLVGLLAHGIYGLTDAVTLGAKPSAALWGVLGLLISLGSMVPSRQPGVVGPRIHPQGWRPRLRLGLVSFALLVLASPLALNTALLFLHKPETAVAAAKSPLLEADLDVAAALAWGPYSARVWAARALVARLKGDEAAEAAALDVAIQRGAWDSSLSHLLADLRRR
jgi:hypothetical protein